MWKNFLLAHRFVMGGPSDAEAVATTRSAVHQMAVDILLVEHSEIVASKIKTLKKMPALHVAKEQSNE